MPGMPGCFRPLIRLDQHPFRPIVLTSCPSCSPAPSPPLQSPRTTSTMPVWQWPSCLSSSWAGGSLMRGAGSRARWLRCACWVADWAIAAAQYQEPIPGCINVCATLALLPVLPACLLVSQLRRSRSPHRHHCRRLMLQVTNDSAYLSNRVEEGDGFLVAVGKTHPVVA